MTVPRLGLQKGVIGAKSLFSGSLGFQDLKGPDRLSWNCGLNPKATPKVDRGHHRVSLGSVESITRISRLLWHKELKATGMHFLTLGLLP